MYNHRFFFESQRTTNELLKQQSLARIRTKDRGVTRKVNVEGETAHRLVTVIGERQHIFVNPSRSQGCVV